MIVGDKPLLVGQDGLVLDEEVSGHFEKDGTDKKKDQDCSARPDA